MTYKLSYIFASVLSIVLLTACTAGDANVEPVVSELGIKTSKAGLAELQSKVEGRDDVDCGTTDDPWIVCFIGNDTEIYTFTPESHPAYPAVMYRGFSDGSGTLQLEERGWYAGSKVSADAFFIMVKESGIDPQPPE